MRGGDWDRDRPRVVVVETATPVGFDPVARRVQIEDFSPTWEQELLAHGYLFAAADGVNRWYVRSEDEHLLQHFRFPVSSLDEFIPYSLVLAQRPVGELSESLNQLRGELDVAREELARDRERLGVIEGRSAAAEATLAALLRSRSWRYTAPLRTASAWLHRRRMSTTPAGEPRSPALAQAPAPAPLRVALYAGVVVERDAVSTSLLHKLRILRQLEELGYAVTTIVFTQGTDVDRPGVAIVGPEQLVEEGACLAADLHIYEFGMHYELFDTHVRLPQQARTLVVDHSTTPPTLVGSVEAAEKCAEAIQRRDKLSWAHHVTNVSEHNRAHHLDRGVDGNRLSVLHLPPVAATGRAVIDSAPIASRPGPVHLLFVGRFVKAKGVEDLLDVFETVVERHGDEVRLTLVGNADFSEPDLLERIDRSVARGFVERRSNLGDTELASLYRSAHAFVLPSYHEGYCVPVVEAMWAGTFPLTYDAGNLPIVSGGLGALVPTGDRRGLERSIEDFIGRVAASRADGRLMLATNGFGEMTEADWRAAVAAHLVDYSWERYAEGFLDLMARVLADRPEGVPEWLRHDRGGLVRQLRP